MKENKEEIEVDEVAVFNKFLRFEKDTNKTLNQYDTNY